MEYFSPPEWPDSSWLTAVLRKAGHLPTGEVTGVVEAASSAFNSKTSFLRVRYSGDAPPGMPERLVLKINLPDDWAITAGADEVRFYRLVGQDARHPPVVPACYAAAIDENSGRSYLLLQDLSLTHAPPVTREQQISMIDGVPSATHQESVIDTLAQLHAYWWKHPSLAAGTFEVGYWSRDAERFSLYLARRRASWERLLAHESAWFPSRLRTFYEWLFERLPVYWEKSLASRFQSRANLTLIHGDAYFANFLCPKQAGTGPTYLVDWQSPSWDICAYDLVNLLATFWTHLQRQANDRELSLLRRYHAELQRRGVVGYTWDDLAADFRAGLIFWVLMPVQDAGDGSPQEYWWPKMQCLLEAFEDWACADFLTGPR